VFLQFNRILNLFCVRVIQEADPFIRIFHTQASAHFTCNEVKYQNFKTLIRGVLINSKISVISKYTSSLLAVTFADVCVAHVI
jgi:hypothetical protein